MEHQNDKILDQRSLKGVGPSGGYKAPEGYFESFAERMASSLPVRPELESAAQPVLDRTFWQKVRPYTYMAAMFAGIWLMLQMFTMLSGKTSLEPMENNPTISAALQTDDFVNDYIYRNMSSHELVDYMLDEGEIDENSEFTNFFEEEEVPFDSTYILP